MDTLKGFILTLKRLGVRTYSCFIIQQSATKDLKLHLTACDLISKWNIFQFEQLDNVLKWLGLPDTEAYSQVKWAVLNTVLILSRHHQARLELAKAMSLGESVGYCIDTIENFINGEVI